MPEPRADDSSPAVSRGKPLARRLAEWLTGLADARLILLVALPLFALAAWPLLLVDLPPFQDLPNHVATAYIIAHPELYPDYAFNGFWKSNSLLTLWLFLAGSERLFGAARLFTALVLATTAFALPTFVVRFAGRSRLWVASLFVWPLVHGFFVSMGMLNFALAFALSLLLLTLLDQQRERPTWGLGAAIAALALVVWYAHPFPLAVVVGLVALYAVRRATWRARSAAVLGVVSPLVPAGVLALAAAGQHLIKAEPVSAVAAATSAYLNPRQLVEHCWRDVSGALTWWGGMTIVPALLLPYFVWKRHRDGGRVGGVAGGSPTEPPAGRSPAAPEPHPLFSTAATALLAAAYVALPFMLSNWWYFNCRLVPFLWAGLVVRLPSRLPRPVGVLLLGCALSFSAVMGIDYLRLDRDRALFTAGVGEVPVRATLLPLLFAKRKTSDFIGSLTHAWGYYAVAKSTSVPLVFAVERSYPITYRGFPPASLIPPTLDRFAELQGTPARMCQMLRRPVDAGCAAAWRELWRAFWNEAEPRFSHVLTWAMPPEARPMIPQGYRPVFTAGELEIHAREAAAARSSPARIDAPK